MLLEKLRRENEDLRAKLSVEVLRVSSASKAPSDDGAEIARLEDEADRLVTKIENQKKLLRELDAKVGQAKSAVEKRRKTSRPPMQEVAEQVKQIRKAEYTLADVCRKHDAALARNRKLQAEIDEQRRMQAAYKEWMAKQQSELVEVDTACERMRDDARELLERRKELQEAIGKLRATSEKEENDFMAECRSIASKLEENIVANACGSGIADQLPSFLGKLCIAEEDKLRLKLETGKQQLVKDKEDAARLRAQVSEYQEAFVKISRATGFKDAESFIQQFLDTEDENFHRFQYLNALNSDYERLEEEIAALRAEERLYAQQTSATDAEWARMVGDMQRKLKRIVQHTAEQEAKLKETNDAIAEVSALIKETFVMLECKGERVATADDVNTTNLMEYLGAIEEAATDLMRIYGAATQAAQLQATTLGAGAAKAAQIRLGKALPPRSSTEDSALSTIVPPPVREREDDFFRADAVADPELADDERPLESHELRARVRHYLSEQVERKGNKKALLHNTLLKGAKTMKEAERVKDAPPPKALDLSADARPSLEPASDAAGPPAQPTAEPTSAVDDQAAAAQAGANPDAPADLAP